MMTESRKITYTIIMTALFTALAFVMTYISIPVGVSKVHLGNFVCLIAALLCGPLIGGISGAVGMGLNDIVSGYGPDTIIRTLIVKFLMGYIVGLVFRALIAHETHKDNYDLRTFYIILTSLFSIIFITLLVLYITHGANIVITEKYTFKSSLWVVIASGVLALIFALLLIFSRKMSLSLQCVLIATTLGTIINIIAEFLLKIPLKMLFLDFSFEAALAYATASLPGAIITSIITIIVTTLIYTPLYDSTKKFNKFNTLYNHIQDATTYKTK